MAGLRDRLHYPNDGILDAAGLGLHPFSGFPAEVIGHVGEDGISGTPFHFDDFMKWEGPIAEGAAGGWLLSGVTGAATVTLGSLNGEIVLTADATANCSPTLQLGASASGTPFLNRIGKRLWFFVRVKIGTITSTEFLFGLATPKPEPTITVGLPSDGIFFSKVTANTQANVIARKDAASTTKANATAVLADGVYTILGFMVDLAGNILPYQDGRLLGASAIPVGTANIPLAGDILQPILAIRGASQTATFDWFLAAGDR